jgi:hypothetical protein
LSDHLINNLPWADRIGIKAPRIDARGSVEPARILGVGDLGELSSGEARELAEALKGAADKVERLNAAMMPHLDAALEAGKAVT